MAKIGVLGGMGPAASADFLTKLVHLTPATCDQEHLPVVVANLPHVPDRSRAILGQGASPLPAMCASIDLLVQAGCGVIAVPLQYLTPLVSRLCQVLANSCLAYCRSLHCLGFQFWHDCNFGHSGLPSIGLLPAHHCSPWWHLPCSRRKQLAAQH